jgi:hypothetical protein
VDGHVHPLLRATVERYAADDAIAEPGITRSLLQKIDAAQAALDRGQPHVAVQVLRALEQEIAGLPGQHIAEAAVSTLLTDSGHVRDGLSRNG